MHTQRRAAGKAFSMPHARRARPAYVVLSWVLVAAMLCFIFFMSAHTSSGLDDDLGFFSLVYRDLQAVQAQVLGQGVDVLHPIAHFCEYTLLGALLANALRASGVRRGRAWLVAILLASAYGVTDEFHQLFVPGRACDPADWVVDTCGGALGATLVRVCTRKRR